MLMQCTAFFVVVVVVEVEDISESAAVSKAFAKAEQLCSSFIFRQMKNARCAKKSLRLSTTEASYETNAELVRMSTNFLKKKYFSQTRAHFQTNMKI